MKRGKFITLEGGEGVGKSTLINALKRELQVLGQDAVDTREPGGSTGAEAIRQLILHPPETVSWSAYTQTLLFYAARKDHLEQVILPALGEGKWVLCDRFADSTRAYQAVAGEIDMQFVEQLDEMVVGKDQPDLTLVLQLPLDTANQRRIQRGGPADAFEKQDDDFHQSVHNAFSKIAESHAQRCVTINADQSPEDVLQDALSAVESRLFP